MKAIVSGLVIAGARVLLASSLNTPSSKTNSLACVCQKPFSGYVQLISEWRANIYRKNPDSLVRLFPFEELEEYVPATSTDSDLVSEVDGEGTGQGGVGALAEKVGTEAAVEGEA